MAVRRLANIDNQTWFRYHLSRPRSHFMPSDLKHFPALRQALSHRTVKLKYLLHTYKDWSIRTPSGFAIYVGIPLWLEAHVWRQMLAERATIRQIVELWRIQASPQSSSRQYNHSSYPRCRPWPASSLQEQWTRVGIELRTGTIERQNHRLRSFRWLRYLQTLCCYSSIISWRPPWLSLPSQMIRARSAPR